MIYLDAANAVNGFTEVNFTLGNVITIVMGAIATITGFGAVKYGLNQFKAVTTQKLETIETTHEKDLKTLKEEYEKDIKLMQENFDREYRNVQERFIDSQREKRKIREELKKEIDICHKRTDAVNLKLDNHQKEFQVEIKKVDRELGEIKTGINSIKDLLQNRNN